MKMPKKHLTTKIISSSSSDSEEERSPAKNMKLKKKRNGEINLEYTTAHSKNEQNSYNIYTKQIDIFANKRTNLGVPNLDSNPEEDEDDDLIRTFGMFSNAKPVSVSPKKISRDKSTPGEVDSGITRSRSTRKLRSTPLEVEKDVGEYCVPSPKSTRKSLNTKILSDLDKNFEFLTGDCSDLDDSLKFDDIPVEEMTVRIMCRTKLHKFTMKMDQKFSTIMDDLAQILKANISDISILLDNEAIGGNDSPASRHLKSCNILTCLASCSTAIINTDHAASVLVSDDENFIEVVIQSTWQQRKKIPFKCDKTKPLRELAEEFAKQNSIDPNKITMKFDGDVIDLDDNAADLDMESGDCIDIVIR